MMNGAFVVVIVASLSLAAVSTRPYENSALRASRRYTGPSGRLPCVDQAMVADLAQAALASGASIPAALKALHCALGEEEEASGLDVAARPLLLGGGWEEAWADVPERFAPLREALEPAWVDGAAAVPLLERTSASLREGRIRTAREAAAALGSKLVLPLGLCFLPAFVVLGIVPTVIATGMKFFE